MSRLAGVDGIVFSDALADEGAVVFAKAFELGLEGIISKLLQERAELQLAQEQEPGFRQDVTAMPRKPRALRGEAGATAA